MAYEGVTREEFLRKIPRIEIQSTSHSCWAASMSVLLRLNDVSVTESQVMRLYPDWVFEGITAKQLSDMVVFFNETIFHKETSLVTKEREMRTFNKLEQILPYSTEYKGFIVFIKFHFVVVLGADDDLGTLLYYDPSDGVLHDTSMSYFFTLGTQFTIGIQ